MFQYKGEISASKSLYNRALILKSYFPDLQLQGQSSAKDVLELIQALNDLSAGKKEFNLGEGGTTFRFFLLKCSRLPGQYIFNVGSRLYDRPNEEFKYIGDQLGFNFSKQNGKFFLKTSGWKSVNCIEVPSHRSSQFVSAVVLNSWNLNFDLKIKKTLTASESYFEMTRQLCSQLGLHIDSENDCWVIQKNQQITSQRITIEPDMSSVFALACCAAVCGHIVIPGINFKSLQPDVVGLNCLKSIGINIQWYEDFLEVQATQKWNGLDIDLSHQPDLFPCLCALLSLAQTPSKVIGTEVLQYKESDRLFHMTQAMRALGVGVEEVSNGIRIQPIRQLPKQKFVFETHNDHRLAFAFQIWRLAGLNIDIQNQQVVNKSFPEFWSIVDGQKP